MKRFISTILIAFLLLSTITFLFGCDTDTENETPGTQETGGQTDDLTDAKQPAQDEPDETDHLGNFFAILTDGSQLLMQTADFEMNMWNTVYKYPESKQIDETFAYLYEKSGSADTIADCHSTLNAIYTELSKDNSDAELNRLLANCKISYEILHVTVTMAHGTYADFYDEYNDAVVDMAYDYDELVDYMIEKGYLEE